MKKFYNMLSVALVLSFATFNSYGQIALEESQITACQGELIEMCGAFSGQSDPLNVDDKHTGLLDIGFDFEFYGQSYNQCVLSDNGYLSFKLARAAQHSSFTWTGLQGSTDAFNAIHAAMVDLLLRNFGELRYERFGSPGERRFIAEWCDVPVYGCESLRVTTQVILYETTNIIEVHTTNIDPIVGNCPSASFGSYSKVVQGVVSPNNTQSVYTPGRDINGNWGALGATNDGVRFTPDATAPGGYTVEEIPYNSFPIIKFANSDMLTWYASNDLINPIGTGACVTTVVDKEIPYYIAKYDGLAGCTDVQRSLQDTVFINFPSFLLEETVEICQGESYSFQGDQYYTEGQYLFEYTNVLGCDSTYILNLTVNPLPNAVISGSNFYEVCEGDQVTFGMDDQSTSNTYQWYRNGNAIPGETGKSITVSTTGHYHAEASSNKGCNATTGTVKVNVYDVPVVSVTNNQTEVLCTFDTISLTAQSNIPVDFYWEPDYVFRRVTGNIGETVEGVFSKGNELVTVRGVSAYGCASTAEVMVYAKPCCEVNVPSAFSPNNDGVNDVFAPILRPTQKIINFSIYDRYGQVVYNTSSTSETAIGWDGTYPNGEHAKIDSYLYTLEYTCADGQNYNIQGSVTLIR